MNMKLQNKRIASILILFLLLFLWGKSDTYALDKGVQQLVDWETQANAATKNRSNQPFKVSHYEIPLSKLSSDLTARIPEQLRSSLIFEKNGESYVRWIINPEDTKWHKELETWLLSQNLSAAKMEYFTGYLTSSRSLILEDPQNGSQFSAKVSTNFTGGAWRDKKQRIDDATQVRLADEYVKELQQKHLIKNFLYLEEPGMFAIKDVDQAMIIRQLGSLPQSENYYLPGFSALHEDWGKKIALLNGSTNPARFWNENYNKPLARSLAELMALTGMSYDSPHSQNFLIELDSKMKPTGKIVLRDLGDSHINANFFKAIGKTDFIKKWDPDFVNTYYRASVAIFHGNKYPSWINYDTYDQWGSEYFKEFENEYSRLTGIPTDELSKFELSRDGDFFIKNYKVDSPAFQHHFRYSSCLRGGKFTADGLPCPKTIPPYVKTIPTTQIIPPSNAPTANTTDCLHDVFRQALGFL